MQKFREELKTSVILGMVQLITFSAAEQFHLGDVFYMLWIGSYIYLPFAVGFLLSEKDKFKKIGILSLGMAIYNVAFVVFFTLGFKHKYWECGFGHAGNMFGACTNPGWMAHMYYLFTLVCLMVAGEVIFYSLAIGGYSIKKLVRRINEKRFV